MQSDQLVSARDILRAIEEVRRLGIDRLLVEWERREPDLAEHMLERISELHRRIAAIAPHPRAERQLMRRVETLVLVLLTALRRALLRQWRDDESELPVDDTPKPGADPDSDRGGEKGGDFHAS